MSWDSLPPELLWKAFPSFDTLRLLSKRLCQIASSDRFILHMVSVTMGAEAAALLRRMRCFPARLSSFYRIEREEREVEEEEEGESLLRKFVFFRCAYPTWRAFVEVHSDLRHSIINLHGEFDTHDLLDALAPRIGLQVIEESDPESSFLGGTPYLPEHLVTHENGVTMLRRDLFDRDEYEFVAQLHLSAINRLIQKHWPLGGCPFAGRLQEGRVWIFGSRELEEMYGKDHYYRLGSSSLSAPLVRVMDVREATKKLPRPEGKNRRETIQRMRELRKRFNLKKKCEAIAVAPRVECSLPAKMNLYVEHASISKSALFGHIQLFNPPVNRRAHEDVFQSWSMFDESYKFGDLDSLVMGLSYDSEELLDEVGYEIRD